MARYHLKTFKLEEIPNFNRYAEQDILTAIILFRLAILFNTSRQATKPCEKLNLKVTNTDWELTLPVDYLVNNPLIKQNLDNESVQLSNIGIKLTISV